ncbi:calcium-binding EF-hand family protein [Actinidia rufa]|uniref:Calcium-binding EF-hand family protein n=1 Tax=Actinidia rufa TaxID=165716 RepID=A0A7J0EDV3_9ERIC|nr:calcium-binding EF-hand family protein [Actinidia rufa]
MSMEIITKQYERVFNHFDEDGNGRISSSRVTHLCGVYGRKPVGVRGGGCVGAGGLRWGRGAGVGGLCEANGRGQKRKKRKVEELREAFKMYEMEEGCGCITPKSLKRVLGRLGQAKTMDECRSMIAHFDLNGDGVLNFDEFRIMMS